MPPGHLFPTMTLTLGVLLMLAWAYATRDNPRSLKMLAKSLGLFVFPGAVLWLLPTDWLQFPLSMWFIVFLEEFLKAFASRTERAPIDRFWLVALFEIWELMLTKTLWGLEHEAAFGDWGRLQILGITSAAALPVLMHVTTAAIYAFYFEGRLWAAFSISWLLHATFNQSVDLLGISPLAFVVQLFSW